jgi:hypothetical protein
MTDTAAKIILDELREQRIVLDKIDLTINGDGDEKKGLVRRVDALRFEVRTARWVIGIVCSAIAWALAGRWIK